MSSDSPQGCPDVGSWIRDSALFRRSAEMQEQIGRHKWIESEKVGHDIGWERATVSWLVRRGNCQAD